MFGQLLTAMVTPFTADNRIDWDSVEKIIEHLIDTGTDTIVVVGTTGESPTLTHQEKLELYRFTVERAAGRAKVIAGTGSNNTAQSIALSKEAQECGVDGLLLVVPYYNKPSQQGLYQHFAAIANETSLPIVLYNIPGRTGINMTIETMVELSKLENIVAIKESSGDLDQIAQLIAKVKEEAVVYSGDDNLLLPILSLGGAGIVSVASHIVGTQIKELINAYKTGNPTQATEINQQLYPVFKGLFITSNPVPIKYVLSQLNFCRPNVRLPLVEMTEQEKSVTDQWLTRLQKSAVIQK